MVRAGYVDDPLGCRHRGGCLRFVVAYAGVLEDVSGSGGNILLAASRCVGDVGDGRAQGRCGRGVVGLL